MRARLENAAVSLLAALMVFAIVYLSAWYNLRGVLNVCPRQSNTRYTLRSFSNDIRDLRHIESTNHKPPQTLQEIPYEKRRVGRVFADDRIVDDWGNELRYLPAKDGSFELYSLGRDGIAGGIGLDADIYSDGREGAVAWPTFAQFYFTHDREEVDHGGFLFAAIVTALVVFVAVFRSAPRYFRTDSKQPAFSKGALVRVGGIVLLAIAIGVMIMPVHVPNGH